MFVFMVKSTIDPMFKHQILDYYLAGHLDEVVATKCFGSWTCEYDAGLKQLIVRYKCTSQEKYQEYLTKYAPTFRLETQQKFSTQILAVERNFSEVIE